MSYLITIWNASSPDRYVSQFHEEIGTESFRCENRSAALVAIERRIALARGSIDRIQVRHIKTKNRRSVEIKFWFWYRDSSTALPDLK